MLDVTPAILEALTFGLKVTNVAKITIEEVQNCIRAILERTNPAAEGEFRSAAPLPGVCEDVVGKAVERLQAE